MSNILAREFSIGFELEFLNLSPENAGLIISSEYGYCKPEGDTNGGFELESAVFDRNDFIKGADFDFWQELFETLNEQSDADVDEFLGHHIHVNYNACSARVLHKIMSCMHYNHEWLSVFAGRSVCHYQEWSLMTLNEVICPVSSYRPFIHCNVLRPDKTRTTEFRFFVSTMDYEVFLKNMQFVIAWYDFAESCEDFLTKARGILIREFLQFVNTNYSIYPNLFKFINEVSSDIKKITI